jgi:hypothetical protein
MRKNNLSDILFNQSIICRKVYFQCIMQSSGERLWVLNSEKVPFHLLQEVIVEFFFLDFTTVSSNSDHVGWRSKLPDTILEGDHPRTIPPKFGLKWLQRRIFSSNCVLEYSSNNNIFSFVAMSADSVPSSKINIFQNKLIYCRQ